MNKLAVEIEKPRLFYGPDKKKAYALETYMIENEISEIGNYEIGYKNRIMKNGEERYSGLDMTPEERVIRTLMVKKMDKAELDMIHVYEKERMNRFLTVSEVQKLIKHSLKMYDKWSEELMKFVQQWMKDNRTWPEYKKYKDFLVPKNFIYDLEYDGMTWHHAVDNSVFYCFTPINFVSMKGKGQRQLQEVMG